MFEMCVYIVYIFQISHSVIQAVAEAGTAEQPLMDLAFLFIGYWVWERKKKNNSQQVV